LLDNRAMSIFFIVTEFTKDEPIKDPGLQKLIMKNLIFTNELGVDFLTWADCKKLLDNGMQIGSHTCNHLLLIDQSEQDVRRELADSKKTIEEKLNINCKHFCAPYGVPDVHYDSKRDPVLAKDVGYETLSSTQRGSFTENVSPMHIKRDHILANWNLSQLKYFFST
jgi:peptidoglycan/xylan/chitin deacetylase (PgdA/CDA1 family)